MLSQLRIRSLGSQIKVPARILGGNPRLASTCDKPSYVLQIGPRVAFRTLSNTWAE